MPPQAQPFSIAGTGPVSANNIETNVSVWAPALPGAFEKARDASLYPRLGTRHTSAELARALDGAAGVDQTFCLTVNNVILVFSASRDEHTAQCRRVLQALQDRSMRADLADCVFSVARAADAGVRLDQVAPNKVYMVINEGVPRKAASSS